MEDYSRNETTMRDFLTVIFRHKIINIVIYIVVISTVYMGMELRTPYYESSVKILVSASMQKDVEYLRDLGRGSITGTQMALVVSKPIIERTVRALALHKRPIDYEKNFATKLKRILIDYSTKESNRSLQEMTPARKEEYLISRAVGDLMRKVQTFPQGETSLINLSVRDYSPQAATQIANVLSRSFIIFDIEQQIAELQLTYGEKNETILKLRNYIKKLEESLDGRILPDIEALGPASVKIVSQAGYANFIPLRPNKNVALVLAFVMSMAGGVLLSFGIEYLNHTLKSGRDIEKYLKIPFLGSVPEKQYKDHVLIKDTNPASRYTQSFQNLSNQVYISMNNQNLKSLILSDVEGSKETAIVIANLGLCLSYTRCSVLIVDANLRNSSMNDIFNIPESPGLSDVIEGKIAFEDAVQVIGLNMNVLTTGESTFNPVAQLNSPALSNIFKKVKELYDVVLINCSNIKDYTDAIILSAVTDGFVLVLNEGKVKRQIIEQVIAPIKQNNIDIIGAVIANRRYVIPEIIYKLI